MKIAVTSSDGINVDLHFGKAKAFYIYEVNHGKKKLVETRETMKYSPTDKFLYDKEEHSMDEDHFTKVLAKIKDCDRLYTVSIGETPKKKLMDNGIEVKLCQCLIETIPTCSGKCNH